MPRILFKNAHILSMDPTIGDLPRGDLLVVDDRIADLGPSIEVQADETIDAAGHILIPGLVNAHIHTWETALRGMGGNWAGSDYFTFFHARLAPLYTPEDTFIGTLIGALSQIDAGVTTIFDWCHNNSTPAHSDAAVDALFESGIRAVFGHGTVKPHPKPGQPHFSQIPHPLDEIRRLRTGRLSDDNALVTLAMAILGPDYSTLEVCRQDFGAAIEFDLLSSAHVWGHSNRLVPGGYRTIAAEGLLTSKHNVVHANYIEDDELRLLVDSGASVTATPAIEMRGHVRRPLSGRVRDMGGKPSIGVDSEVGSKGDMFDLMRATLLVERLCANQATVRRLDAERAASGEAEAPKPVGTGGSPIKKVAYEVREMLEWATVNNAQALGLAHRIGSLTPGKQADVVMLRRDRLHALSAQDAVQMVVSYAEPSDVDTVMIAGRLVKRQGRLAFGAVAQRSQQLRASAERLLHDAGIVV